MPLYSATKSPYSESTVQSYEWQGVDGLELERHLIKIPVEHGQIGDIYAAKGQLIYHRRAVGGTQSIYSVNIESGEEQRLMADAEILDVSADGHLLALQDKRYQFTDLTKPDTTEPIDFAGCKIQLDPNLEKHQVLRDAWGLYRDFYYDPKLHGRNWNEEWERYAKLIEGAHSKF